MMMVTIMNGMTTVRTIMLSGDDADRLSCMRPGLWVYGLRCTLLGQGRLRLSVPRVIEMLTMATMMMGRGRC